MPNDQTSINPVDTEASKGITLKEIFFIIKKHIIVILTCLVVGGVGGWIYSTLRPTDFTAHATMLASPESTKSSQYTSSDYYYMDYLSSTFVTLAKEDSVLTKAKEKLDAQEVNLSKGQIAGGLSVSCESLIISLSYTISGIGDKKSENYVSVNKEAAITICNAIAEGIYDVSNARVLDTEGHETSEFKYNLLGGNLEILSPATMDTTSASNHLSKDILIYMAIGLAIAIVYIILRETLDTRFKTDAEVERALGLAVLAGIPFYTQADIDNAKENSETNRM